MASNDIQEFKCFVEETWLVGRRVSTRMGLHTFCKNENGGSLYYSYDRTGWIRCGPPPAQATEAKEAAERLFWETYELKENEYRNSTSTWEFSKVEDGWVGMRRLPDGKLIKHKLTEYFAEDSVAYAAQRWHMKHFPTAKAPEPSPKKAKSDQEFRKPIVPNLREYVEAKPEDAMELINRFHPREIGLIISGSPMLFSRDHLAHKNKFDSEDGMPTGFLPNEYRFVQRGRNGAQLKPRSRVTVSVFTNGVLGPPAAEWHFWSRKGPELGGPVLERIAKEAREACMKMRTYLIFVLVQYRGRTFQWNSQHNDGQGEWCEGKELLTITQRWAKIMEEHTEEEIRKRVGQPPGIVAQVIVNAMKKVDLSK